MVICKISCPVYGNCKEHQLSQRCVYDLGIFNSEEDKYNGDDYIDKMTY